MSDLVMLRQSIEADIAREGRMASSMVRAGLALDMLDRIEQLEAALRGVVEGARLPSGRTRSSRVTILATDYHKAAAVLSQSAQVDGGL